VATLKLESLNIEVEAERLQAVLDKREEYLRWHDLPLDHCMADGADRTTTARSLTSRSMSSSLRRANVVDASLITWLLLSTMKGRASDV